MEKSVATWQPELGMAAVVRAHGAHWNAMGIVRDGSLYCHVEEAVYLVEQGALELRTSGGDGRAMPKQETYGLLEAAHGCCSWDAYRVYVQLKKFGYIVGRHNVSWMTLPDASRRGDEERGEARGGAAGSLEIMFDVRAPRDEFQKSLPGIPAFSVCIARDCPPGRVDAQALQHGNGAVPVKFASAESGHVSFFSFETVPLPMLL